MRVVLRGMQLRLLSNAFDRINVRNNGVKYMRLLVDARNLGTRPSGVGMYAYNFIYELTKCDDVEMHVIVDVVESNEITTLRDMGTVSIHAYGKPVNKSVSVYGYFNFVKKIIKSVKPDIFWETNNLAPVKLKNPYGKYVVTIHDVFPLTLPECYKKLYPLYFKLGVNKSIKCCDAIIYNSETTKNEVRKFFPHAKQKKDYISFIIIPPIEKVQAEKQEGFLYMGNLEKRKGVDILLDAYDRYLTNGGKKKLVIAGKVCEADIETKLEEQLEKHKSLEYVGYVKGDERAVYYSACECFVFPSRAEGFGMPVIEALSCERNVITSDLEIFEEIAGGYVDRFAIGNNRATAVEGLADCMMKDIDKHRIQGCHDVVARYAGSVLGKQMYRFMRELE